MITPAQRAEIRRLFYGEHWKVGTIAAQLGLHHETVRARGGARDGRIPARCVPAQHPPTRICRSSVTPWHSTRVCAPRGSTRWSASAAMPVRSSRSAVSCSACGPRPAAPSTAGSSPCPASRHKSTGARSARYASDRAPARSPDSSWSSATRARWPHSSPSTRRWRASCGATSTPSRRWEAVPATWCTTTCAAPCSTVAAPPSSFTPACSSSPATTTSRPAPAHRDGEMRREKLNGRSNTYATRSLPPAPSATSTTSTRSFAAGATTSLTGGGIPTSLTAPSPTSGPTRSPVCCRCPPIPSRPIWCAPSAPARPPTSASTAMPTRFPTPTSESR